MKISRIETFTFGVPFARDFYGPMEAAVIHGIGRDHVIVKVESDDGTTGIGEVPAHAKFQGEPVGNVRTAIDEYYGPAIIGVDPRDSETIRLRTSSVTLQGNPLARCGIEIALFDLIGKTAGLPVCKLMGGMYRDRVPVAHLIEIATPEENGSEAAEMASKGYFVFKIKIAPGQDVSRVAAVREAVGNEAVLWVDANGGYDAGEAIRVLRRLERFDVALAEQPVPRWDVEGMKRTTLSTDIKIVADEGIFTSHDALLHAREHAADIFNLKLPKMGGFTEAKRVAHIAEAAGIPCLVGNMHELGIGIAAGLHLCASTAIASLPSELCGFLLYTTDVLRDPFEVTNGFLPVPTGPGLGVDVDWEKVQSLASSPKFYGPSEVPVWR
jgi:L-alanine-DL-glutamate epimerase-like enolase superfamily enzyme